jgi:GTPase SAR1 family protein
MPTEHMLNVPLSGDRGVRRGLTALGPKNLYFAGTAGCGKSTLTGTFQQWIRNEGYEAITVNLDPGVETVPYEPDVDIRDWVRLSEIMKEYGLGPNGAQVLAADMLALNVGEVVDVIHGFGTDYVLIDTPGQLELFAFRQSGRVVLDAFDRESSVLLFLFDPVIARNPNGFVTSMMLSATVQFRLDIPMISALSKSDLLSDEERAMLDRWGQDKYSLWSDLGDEAADDSQTPINMEFLQALETVGSVGGMGFVSSDTWEGIPDIYSIVQQLMEGGEDVDG